MEILVFQGSKFIKPIDGFNLSSVIRNLNKDYYYYSPLAKHWFDYDLVAIREENVPPEVRAYVLLLGV